MLENEGADTPEPDAADADDTGNTSTKTEDLVPSYKFEEAKEGRAKERAKRRELEAKLAEYEAKQRKAEESKMREQEQYKELLEEREKELEEIRSQIADRDRREKESSLFTSIADATGISNRTVSKLLKGMLADGDIEMPEELDKRTVEAVARKLKDSAPELFQSRNSGGTPPKKGLASSQSAPAFDDIEAWKERAKEMGARMSGSTKR